MKVCEICGREIKSTNHIDGKLVCPKHYSQFKRHGKFLDSNPRTTKDLNDYRIDGETVVFNVYNKECIKVSEFIIDLDDLEKIKYHKWRIDAYGYIISGQRSEAVRLQRFLLDVTEPELVVDHINNNPLDNRKSNLRICTRLENNFNKIDSGRNNSGIMGLYWSSERRKWCPEIRANNIRVHLGRWDDINEAAVARMHAEKLVFKEYQNYAHKIEEFTAKVPEERIKLIYQYVEDKLKDKNIV